MPEEQKIHFTTSPAIVASCKMFFTNFSNLWCFDKYKSDLRVIFTLLLRIDLAKKRFFRQKKTRTDKVAVVKNKRSKPYKAPLKKLMLELFKVVTKFEHGQFQKLSVIDKYVDIIFKDNSTANAPLINRNTTDISDSEGISRVKFFIFIFYSKNLLFLIIYRQ